MKKHAERLLAGCDVVIFDFDGLIVDTESLGIEVSRELLARRFDIDLTVEDQRSFYGLFDPEYYARLRELYGLEGSTQELLEAHDSVYDQKLSEVRETLPGVESMLDDLRATGSRLALCSGSFQRQISRVLGNVALEDRFEVIVAAHDTDRHKPHPEPYLLTAEKLGTPPERCLVLEDSDPGVLAARRAGMAVIGVEIGSRGRQTLDQAHSVVWSLEE